MIILTDHSIILEGFGPRDQDLSSESTHHV